MKINDQDIEQFKIFLYGQKKYCSAITSIDNPFSTMTTFEINTKDFYKIDTVLSNLIEVIDNESDLIFLKELALNVVHYANKRGMMLSDELQFNQPNIDY